MTNRQSFNLLMTATVLVGATLIVQAASASPQSSTPEPDLPDLLARGQRLYEANCQTCHGAKGEGGDARLEKVLGARPKALRSREVQKKGDRDIAASIRQGSGKMKPVEGLTATEIRQIIAYMRTLPSIATD